MPASPFPPLLSAKGVVTHYSDPAGPRAAAGRRRYNSSMRLLAGARAPIRPLGSAPADLVSPTKAAEIAQAVGADWLITGRWVHLDVDRERQAGVRVSALAQAVIEIRVLQASTRRTL